MIKEINADLLTEKSVQVAIQNCNCLHTFGSGLAREIKEKFPEAYEADLETPKEDLEKLGTFSIAKVRDETSHLKYIINLYGQFDFGGGKRFVRYDAIVQGLEKIRDGMLSKGTNNLIIGIPYKMGAARAGGSWPVIEAIIYEVFEEYPFQILICRCDKG